MMGTGIPVQRCRACGFRMAEMERPDSQGHVDDYYESTDPALAVGERNHIRKRIFNILKYKDRGTALDLGSGLGETAVALQKKGFSVVGVDESRFAIKWLRERFPAVRWECGEVLAFMKKNEKFDLITMFHFLEHVREPRRLCSLIHERLNPGGILVIEVPDVSGGAAKLRGRKWEYWLSHHVNYFSLKTLKALLVPMGFRLVGVERKFHMCFPQGIWWKDALHGLLAGFRVNSIVVSYWAKKESC